MTNAFLARGVAGRWVFTLYPLRRGRLCLLCHARSSAGSAILADFLVRGAANDMHVVARERLPDLADSILPEYPKLLGLSEDEGTVLLVKGDTTTVLGRDKAFVYGGKDQNDAGKPFITLYPGNKYNLGSRHVMHRAADDSPASQKFVDELFSKYSNGSAGGATVLVAENDEVFIDRPYGIPAQAKYMPTTTVPQFSVGAMSGIFTSICSQLPAQPAGRGNGQPAGGTGRGRASGPPLNALQSCVARRVSTPIGMHKTAATIILTNDDSGDAKGMAEKIADRLLSPQ